MDRTLIKTIMTTPKWMGLFIAGISLFALAMAFMSQYGFGLLPCILCLYQRIPYAVAIILGGFIFFFSRKNLKSASFLIFLSSLAFFVNAGIALFHTGVERHWWEGLKGCGTPDMSGTVEELLERIKNMPQAKCSEIAWADPLLGWSMANYNAIFCFGLGCVCLVSAILTIRKANGY